jgi:hypothetical protein
VSALDVCPTDDTKNLGNVNVIRDRRLTLPLDCLTRSSSSRPVFQRHALL